MAHGSLKGVRRGDEPLFVSRKFCMDLCQAETNRLHFKGIEVVEEVAFVQQRVHRVKNPLVLLLKKS